MSVLDELSTSIELAACKVIPLSESRVKSPVVFNVPPFNVIKLAAYQDRLCNCYRSNTFIPAEIQIFPVLVLDPDQDDSLPCL